MRHLLLLVWGWGLGRRRLAETHGLELGTMGLVGPATGLFNKLLHECTLWPELPLAICGSMASKMGQGCSQKFKAGRMVLEIAVENFTPCISTP